MKGQLVPVVVVAALAGCSKVHEQFAFTVQAGGVHNLKVSAPLSQQTVKVEMTSDQPVSTWVVLEKEVPNGADEFDPEKLRPEAILAKQKDAKEASLTATVPAKEKFRVYINGAVKTANVTVKIDSQ
ncbi:MAG TPA: hypothetical protein VKE40_03660 [Gemmataceae bacterium]|nr:hypothetical protein [Gemmataceae bacterium]